MKPQPIINVILFVIVIVLFVQNSGLKSDLKQMNEYFDHKNKTLKIPLIKAASLDVNNLNVRNRNNTPVIRLNSGQAGVSGEIVISDGVSNIQTQPEKTNTTIYLKSDPNGGYVFSDKFGRYQYVEEEKRSKIDFIHPIEKKKEDPKKTEEAKEAPKEKAPSNP